MALLFGMRIKLRRDCKTVTPPLCHFAGARGHATIPPHAHGTTFGMSEQETTSEHQSDIERQRELKRQWRKAAIARRKTTSAEERLSAGRRLAEQAGRADLIRPHATVAAFASMGSEISMIPLLAALLDDGCTVLVPRLSSGMQIGWSELEDMASLRDMHNSDGSANMHRPQEPGNDASGPEMLESADIIIVPAFAVDEHGFRLGRGGGWYDRALAYRKDGALVVAVCWPWEPTGDTVPHESHDVPVDGVLTPEGYAPIRR